MSRVVIDSITKPNGLIRIVVGNVIMYFGNMDELQDFVGRTKEDLATREAFADILRRDPNLDSPEDVVRWQYDTQQPTRVVL